MANIDSPFGLKPVRHLLGCPVNGALKPCYIKSDYGTALFIGDPVIITSDGANAAVVEAPGAGRFGIGTLPIINKAAEGDADRIYGVIVAFAPLATNLNLKHNTASTERIAYVNVDPFTVYEIQADGAIPAASVGLNAVLIYTHSGNTTTGLSGVELDTTSDVPDTDASNQLFILGAVNREDNDTTLAHAKVEVLINLAILNAGNAGTLGI